MRIGLIWNRKGFEDWEARVMMFMTNDIGMTGKLNMIDAWMWRTGWV